MSPVPAAALLASLAVLALATERAWVVAVIAAVLLAACLRAPRARRWSYLAGTLVSSLSLFVLSPLLSHEGSHVLWEGPTAARARVSRRDERGARDGGDQALRLAAVGLAFAAYALLLDLDRPAPVGAGSRGARCSPSAWRRGSCRPSSATPPGSSRHSGDAAWR